jgi:hypothetical protein
MFKGTITIRAKNASSAMGKFFEWLKQQEVFDHMWALEISMHETQFIE